MSPDWSKRTMAVYRLAKKRRAAWEPLWRDCAEFTHPRLGAGLGFGPRPGSTGMDRLFDATASDGVDQLAASLLAEIAPPLSQWFGLRPGPAVDDRDRPVISELLERSEGIIQGHFDRSEFAIELHQAFLDVVTFGTATILLQEAAVGEKSAFRFSALPVADVFLDGDSSGAIRKHFRRNHLSLEGLVSRFGAASLTEGLVRTAREEPQRIIELVEVFDHQADRTDYAALVDDGLTDVPVCLASGTFDTSPIMTFRWIKSTGELYGRSPVMTALPDIKTANKVVELVLKNASIATTGIWLAEDDGVLNPANIRLVPGSIIPKAVGSAGLKPLEAPGRFDVSELILQDLRAKIRHALLIDRLGPPLNARMTATEVLERSAETGRLLSAVYGRVQGELFWPLMMRALSILQRRGEIPPFELDRRTVELESRSPLARAQARQDLTNTILWLETVDKLGAEARTAVDLRAAAIWLARNLGVPGELVNHSESLVDLLVPPGEDR